MNSILHYIHCYVNIMEIEIEIEIEIEHTSLFKNEQLKQPIILLKLLNTLLSS